MVRFVFYTNYLVQIPPRNKPFETNNAFVHCARFWHCARFAINLQHLDEISTKKKYHSSRLYYSSKNVQNYSRPAVCYKLVGLQSLVIGNIEDKRIGGRWHWGEKVGWPQPTSMCAHHLALLESVYITVWSRSLLIHSLVGWASTAIHYTIRIKETRNHDWQQ